MCFNLHYCKTLFSLHLNFAIFFRRKFADFNLAYFPGVDILCRQSYIVAQIPGIRGYLISRFYSNHENWCTRKYSVLQYLAWLQCLYCFLVLCCVIILNLLQSCQCLSLCQRLHGMNEFWDFKYTNFIILHALICYHSPYRTHKWLADTSMVEIYMHALNTQLSTPKGWGDAFHPHNFFPGHITIRKSLSI